MNEELLIERVASIYERTFSDCSEGRAFLGKRGITSADVHARHRIGYCNGSLKQILPSSGRVLGELKQLGIFRENGERFLGCLIFPLMNVDGKIANIMGLNIKTGDYLWLLDCKLSAWNIGIIKSCSEVYVMKTILDALSLEMAGFPNVIAVSAGILGDEEKRILGEYDVKTLSGFDGANEFLVKNGTRRLAEKLAKIESVKKTVSKVSTSDIPKPAACGQGFVVSYGPRRYEVKGLEKKTKSLRATLRVEHAGRLFVDTQDLYSSKGRRNLSMEFCRLFDETPETIESDLTRIIKQCEKYEISGHAIEIPVMTVREKEEAEAFGKRPDLIEQIQADFQTCGLIAEETNRLLCYLAMTSRKMDEPLCILILSSSGSGKTFLQDVSLNFCPPEDLVKVTSLSGKALFYRDPASLKHKVLAIEEEPDHIQTAQCRSCGKRSGNWQTGDHEECSAGNNGGIFDHNQPLRESGNKKQIHCAERG